MSTKIYEGWRWSTKLGFAPLKAAEVIISKQIYKRVQKEFLNKDGEPIPQEARRTLLSLVAKLTQFHNLNPYRGPRGDLACDFIIREHEGYFYMIPTDDSAWEYKELDAIEDLEDFRYWNNTDEPEGMEMDAWEERGVLWEKLWDRSNPAVIYSVIDCANPTFSLLHFFCPEWASKEEKELYGLPTCNEDYRAECQAEREAALQKEASEKGADK